MSDDEPQESPRDDVLPLYGAAGPSYRRFALEGGGGVSSGPMSMLAVADTTRILLAFNPKLGKMLWLTPPAARRWAQQVLEACDAAEAGAAADPEMEDQIQAFLEAIPDEQITLGQVIQILEEFQKSFRDKGLCKLLESGGTCQCPLCLIDGVIALLRAVGKPPKPTPDAPADAPPAE